MSVDDGRDDAVVDVTVTGLDVLDRRDALIFRLVSEHRAEGDIANGFDALDRGVELAVDDDATLLIRLDADLLKIETVRVGSTTDGDENNVGVELCERLSSRLTEKTAADAPPPSCPTWRSRLANSRYRRASRDR